MTDSVSAYAETQITVDVSPPLSITTQTVSDADQNGSYSDAITVSGGKSPYVFIKSAGQIPSGITLSDGGILSGTPTTSGSFTFSVTAVDFAGRRATREYRLTVVPQFLIPTTQLNTAITGVSYSFALSGSGGVPPYSWDITAGTLPDGLSLDSTSGTISGTTTALSSHEITVTLTDSGNRTASRSLTITAVGPLAISSSSLPDASFGIFYSQQVVTTGGKTPFTYSYTGQLPAGLSINTSSGVISGTPTTAGYVNFNISVTDSTVPTPQSVTKQLSIRTVIDLPPTVNLFTLPATATSLTIAVTALSATDDVAVTGYLLSASATPPQPDNPAWTSTPPTSYTLVAQGSRTIYAFAKDAAGNLSAPLSATVTITLPDTEAPTVTAFALPTTSNNLTVTISSFIASDNVGVTGYCLAATNSSSACSWSSTIPSSYAFTTAGSKTLYAFAKDAAGNVSNSKSATTTITLPIGGYGDINDDGATNSADALLALQMAIGKRPPDLLKADLAPLINGVPTPDGKVTAADALVILRKAVGLW